MSPSTNTKLLTMTRWRSAAAMIHIVLWLCFINDVFSFLPSSTSTLPSPQVPSRCHQNQHRYQTNVQRNMLQSVVQLSMSNIDDGDYPDDDINLPLFIETNESSTQSIISDIPTSLLQSIERVRQQYFSASATNNDGGTLSNENLLKQLVELTNSKKKQSDAEPLPIDGTLSYPEMERVPGCIATVHVETTLVPLLTNPNEYRVHVQGSSDAMLSGGLVELLSQVLAGSDTEDENSVTASHVLKLKPESLTTALGLQNVLTRGRNDGMASMVRVVQRQIQSLLYEQSDGDAQEQSEEQHDMDTTIETTVVKEDSERKPTVAMLLSGGVDSSVAMHLLLRQNYNVTAFYLRIWLEDELAHLGECPWEDDLQVCQSVCEHAGNITLETVSLGTEYRERVVQYTIEEAQRGRTPNPDIMCNSRIKFGCFLEYIENAGLDFDYVASGHYARLEDTVSSSTGSTNVQKRLFRAPDPVKDQSYFLCALTQKQLSNVIFPIGKYQKAEVRELANEFQLPNRNRPDSQGLCFLGKVKFDEFLSSYLGNRPGDVVDAMTGDIIGRHNGLWYHTVGQRKGIGKVMFPLATAHGPWYVVAKDQEQDIVYVSNRYDEDDFAKARSEFELEDIKWISGTPPLDATTDAEIMEGGWKEVRYDMKIRHGPKIVQGTLMLNGDGSTGNVHLDNKDGGLAPGQYVVFYQVGTLECLGAGVISEKHWAKFLQTKQNEVSVEEEKELEMKR